MPKYDRHAGHPFDMPVHIAVLGSDGIGQRKEDLFDAGQVVFETLDMNE